MCGLFPCIPILGVFIFYFYCKKRYHRVRVQVLLRSLSLGAANYTTTFHVSLRVSRPFKLIVLQLGSFYIFYWTGKMNAKSYITLMLHKLQNVTKVT